MKITRAHAAQLARRRAAYAERRGVAEQLEAERLERLKARRAAARRELARAARARAAKLARRRAAYAERRGVAEQLEAERLDRLEARRAATVSAADRPYYDEQLAYLRRYEAIASWAEQIANANDEEGRVGYLDDQPPKIRVVRARWVEDLDDEEEAYEIARPLDELVLRLPKLPAPDRAAGGVRRVAIKSYTWEIDEGQEAAYSPSWITLGQEFSGRASVRAAERWIQNYLLDLSLDRASRVLRATAIEIAWWFADEKLAYL